MRLFYVVAEDVLHKADFGYRYIALGNGNVLMCVDWTNDMKEMQWAGTAGVLPLPHPLLEQSSPLTDEHVQQLSSRYPVQKGHNVHDLLKFVVKEEPLMRVWAV